MKESGIGRENGVEALESCKSLRVLPDLRKLRNSVVDSQTKSIIVNISSAEDTRDHDDWFAEDTGGKRYG
jgi:hypothetical protein